MLSSLLYKTDAGTFISIQECIFALNFLGYVASDHNPSARSSQRSVTVAAVVTAGCEIQKVCRRSSNPFYKSHCCGGGETGCVSFLQAVGEGLLPLSFILPVPFIIVKCKLSCKLCISTGSA